MFETPSTEQFTIYSKSGCINCVKVKQLLKSSGKPFNIIDCDEYLLETKTEFLDFIKTIAKVEYKMFPMVFLNGDFIGGYTETNKYLEKNAELFMSDF